MRVIARLSFPFVFRFSILARLPLEIKWRGGPVAGQWGDVVDDVARTRQTMQSGGGACVLGDECAQDCFASFGCCNGMLGGALCK